MPTPKILLICVEPNKQEADQSLIGAEQLSYFSTEEKASYKVQASHNLPWMYEKSHEIISTESSKSKQKMYVIDEKGDLYIFDALVHSVLNAGEPVQLAGFVSYYVKDSLVHLCIDNCSGHYTPSLSQFLEVLINLKERLMLPSKFFIKINRLCQLNTSDELNNFIRHYLTLIADERESTEIQMQCLEHEIRFSYQHQETQTCYEFQLIRTQCFAKRPPTATDPIDYEKLHAIAKTPLLESNDRISFFGASSNNDFCGITPSSVTASSPNNDSCGITPTFVTASAEESLKISSS